MPLTDRVLRTIRTYRMFRRGGRVLVACSGGPDSIALLHILRALEQEGELVVAGLGHFNHQLRGEESDGDERFCGEVAAALGLEIALGRADVAGAARESGRSVEDTARSLRYAFLAGAAERLTAEAIAVGHSLDDQAETFLLRLLRGAGARGLAGIRPRAGAVVRPLIEISRAELRQYAAGHGLSFREDSSNADVRIPRNRVRHELLPALREYSPSIVRLLARQAEVARQDEEYLEAAAIDFAKSIVLRTERAIAIDAAALTALPPAMGARIVRNVLAGSARGRFIGFEHIQRVLDFAGETGGAGTVAVPGQVVQRQGTRIVFGPAPDEPFSNFFRFPLSIPGEVELAGWTVSAHELDAPPAGRRQARGDEVVVAAGALRGPLAVRNRRPGDRFQPLGMGGRGRKLQDFLVDRKVARGERDRLPLVVDRDDRIVWVVGQSVAEDFRVTGAAQGVILLKARRLGGVG